MFHKEESNFALRPQLLAPPLPSNNLRFHRLPHSTSTAEVVRVSALGYLVKNDCQQTCQLASTISMILFDGGIGNGWFCRWTALLVGPRRMASVSLLSKMFCFVVSNNLEVCVLKTAAKHSSSARCQHRPPTKQMQPVLTRRQLRTRLLSSGR